MHRTNKKRIQQEIELQTYLNRLILDDRDRKIDDLRKTGEDVDLQVCMRYQEKAKK